MRVVMMPKKNEEDKKQKVTLNINNNLNNILIDLMKDSNISKSKIVENALKYYNETLEDNDITENDIFMLLDKLKNNEENND